MKTFVCNVTVCALLLSLYGPSVAATVGQGRPNGSGLIVNSLTGISLPLVGEVGEIIIDQAVITELRLVEDLAGQIIGLEITGTLNGTLSTIGAPIVDEEFTSTLAIVSSGPGRCDVLPVELGPITLDGLGLVTVDVPVAEVTASGSGAVGSLLCRLGNLLGAVGGATGAVRGIVNAINRII